MTKVEPATPGVEGLGRAEGLGRYGLPALALLVLLFALTLVRAPSRPPRRS